MAGYCTADWYLALVLGILLELLWLDVLELGSVVAPFSGLSFLLIFRLARFFELQQPGPLLLPLLLSIVAAYAASFLERRLRIMQNDLVGRVERWCSVPAGPASDCLSCTEAGQPLQACPAVQDQQPAPCCRPAHSARDVPLSPGAAVLRMTLLRAAGQFLLYCVSYAAIFTLLSFPPLRRLLPPDLISWPMVLGAALLGAVLSLRTRRAFGVLAVSLLGLSVLIWLRGNG